MAMLIYQSSVPEIGDKVKSLEYSNDKEVVWIHMESGKTLICQIYDPLPREDKSEAQD